MINIANGSMEKLAEIWLPPMRDPARADDVELFAALKQMILRVGPDTHERQIRALLGRPNAATYLPSTGCPVLSIAEREDVWSPVAQHQEIADAVADAELIVIENAGHFAPMERPAETTSAHCSLAFAKVWRTT